MKRSHLSTATLALAATAALAAAPAADLTATGGDGELTVSGKVTITEEAVESVSDVSGDGLLPGTDIVGGTISKTSPYSPFLEFSLEIGDPIPGRSVVPEGAQYEWELSTGSGTLELILTGLDEEGGYLFATQTCSPPDPDTNVSDCQSTPTTGTVDGGTLTWQVLASNGDALTTNTAQVRFSAGAFAQARLSGLINYDVAGGFDTYRVQQPTISVTATDADGATATRTFPLGSDNVNVALRDLAPGDYDVTSEVCYRSCTTTDLGTVTVG